MFPKKQFIEYIESAESNGLPIYKIKDKSETVRWKIEDLANLLYQKNKTFFKGKEYNFSLSAFNLGNKNIKLVNRDKSGLLLFENFDEKDLKNQVREIFNVSSIDDDGNKFKTNLLKTEHLDKLVKNLIGLFYTNKKNEDSLIKSGILQYNLLGLSNGDIIQLEKEGWKKITTNKTVLFRNIIDTPVPNEKKWEEVLDFKKYIMDFFPEENNRKLAQIIMGTSLFPKWAPMNLNACLILLGEGSQGKSTFLELYEKVVGIQNTTSLAGSFQKVLGNEKEWGTFRGKIAILGKDSSNEELKATENFKNLASKEITSVQIKMKQGADVDDIYGNLIVATNHDIISSDVTHGFERRIYGITLKGRKSLDGNFKEKLLNNMRVREGMILWLLEGAHMALNLKPNELQFLRDPDYMAKRRQSNKKKAIYGFFLSGRKKAIMDLYYKFKDSKKQLIDENSFADNLFKHWMEFVEYQNIPQRISSLYNKDSILNKITELIEQELNDIAVIKTMFKDWYTFVKKGDEIPSKWEEYKVQKNITPYMEKLLEVYEIDLKKEASDKLIPDVLDLAKDLFGRGE